MPRLSRFTAEPSNPGTAPRSNKLNAECQHHHHDDRLTDHASQHRSLDQHAEAEHHDDGRRHRKPHRQPGTPAAKTQVT